MLKGYTEVLKSRPTYNPKTVSVGELIDLKMSCHFLKILNTRKL